MLRAANWPRIECRLPGRLACWKQTIVVRSWPVGAGTPSGATRTKRVRLPWWSSTALASTSRPYSCEARAGASAAVPGGRSSPTRRAASAVELAAATSAPGRTRLRKARHCALACGNETTRRTSSSRVPGGARRLRWTSSTTSRCTSRSLSKTRWSSEADTEPSIEFSNGTKPPSTSPLSAASSASPIVAHGHEVGDGEVGLGEKRLLGERPRRPQEGDPRRSARAPLRHR